jgi:hypothetical protein
MISNILLYQITLKQKARFLFFFKRNKDIVYQLHYRVDEDRNWYTKLEGGKLCYEHHTKNNIANSLKILEGITERVVFLQSACDYKYEIFDLRKENEALFRLVDLVSKDIEKLRKEHEENQRPQKGKMRGMFLEG